MMLRRMDSMMVSFEMTETLLAVALTLAAFVCLFDRHLLRATLCFIGFALLLTLAWWRLATPWLALAELLLGAIVSGASLLFALGVLPTGAALKPRHDRFPVPLSHGVTRLALSVLWLVLMAAGVRHALPVMALSPSEEQLLIAAGVWVACALGAFALHRHLLRRLLAFNVLGSGVFVLLAGMAGPMLAAQLLILVGLCIAALGTLLGALLIRRLYHLEGLEALDPDIDKTVAQ